MRCSRISAECCIPVPIASVASRSASGQVLCGQYGFLAGLCIFERTFRQRRLANGTDSLSRIGFKTPRNHLVFGLRINNIDEYAGFGLDYAWSSSTGTLAVIAAAW